MANNVLTFISYYIFLGRNGVETLKLKYNGS